MPTNQTQSVLLTMGLDAASAHPELIVDTKTGWNTMKRKFDTVAARRAFGRSDVLAMAHLSLAMGRLAQKGIYLPMTKEMLEGEIKASSAIAGLQKDDHAIGRLSLTPMGEFSYQRKEIADGEDLEENMPSYDYNQGVLTKLKKRFHRMGKRHAAQVKGDVKSIMKEKEALEDEFSKILEELTNSNYYMDNRDGGDDGGDDDDDDDGGGGGGPAKKVKLSSSASLGHINPALNLGGNVALGGLNPPPTGFGGNGSSSGGAGPGGSSTIFAANSSGAAASIIHPGQDDASGVRPTPNEDIVMTDLDIQKFLSGKKKTNLQRLRSDLFENSSRPKKSVSFSAQPQSTTSTTINMSGKGLGAPSNMNNTTNTTINMTNNSNANDAMRESKNMATPRSGFFASLFSKEAVDKTKTTQQNQEVSTMVVGRPLIAANTSQRQSIANITPSDITNDTDDEFSFMYEEGTDDYHPLRTDVPFDLDDPRHPSFTYALSSYGGSSANKKQYFAEDLEAVNLFRDGVNEKNLFVNRYSTSHKSSFTPEVLSFIRSHNYIKKSQSSKDPDSVVGIVNNVFRRISLGDPTFSQTQLAESFNNLIIRSKVSPSTSSINRIIPGIADATQEMLVKYTGYLKNHGIYDETSKAYAEAERENYHLLASHFMNKFGVTRGVATQFVGELVTMVIDEINQRIGNMRSDKNSKFLLNSSLSQAHSFADVATRFASKNKK